MTGQNADREAPRDGSRVFEKRDASRRRAAEGQKQSRNQIVLLPSPTRHKGEAAAIAALWTMQRWRCPAPDPPCSWKELRQWTIPNFQRSNRLAGATTSR